MWTIGTYLSSMLVELAERVYGNFTARGEMKNT